MSLLDGLRTFYPLDNPDRVWHPSTGWVSENEHGYFEWHRPLSDDELLRIRRWLFPLDADLFDFDPPDAGHLRYLMNLEECAPRPAH